MVLRHEMLERAILDDPESPEAYLVYSDWLSGRGDPRGELIALQCNGAPIRAYVREHRRHLLGPLGEQNVRIKWHRGFIDELTIGPPLTNPRDLARLLLEVPTCLLMRKLEVRAELPSVIAGLCELGLPPLLRALTLGSFDRSDRDTEDCPFEAVTSLLPRLTRLEELCVRGPPFWLQAIGPLRSTVRSLGIRWKSLSLSFLQDLFAAPWPRLEKLVLWFGGDTTDQLYFRNHGYPWEIDPEERMAPLLLGTGFESLRELEIVQTDFAERLSEALAHSPLLERLERLDLS